MKLAFLEGERKDIPIGKGHYTIGGGPGDDVNVGDGVAGNCATLILDQRGITLAVEHSSTPVMVNQRPVQEKAILRVGDLIRIAETSLVLRSDNLDISTPPQPFDSAPSDPNAQPKYHLRGINGAYAGQVFAIRGQLTLGPDNKCDVQLPSDVNLSLVIGTHSGRIYLKRNGGKGELIVNGIEVEQSSLAPGDQISMGHDRFLLETPGFVPGDVYASKTEPPSTSNTQVFQAIPEVDQRPAPARKPAANRQKRKKMDSATKRDAYIIGFCVLLSVAMLVWLFSNL